MIGSNYFKRNDSLLADSTGYRPSANLKKVNSNWWHIKYDELEQNLGDMLAEVVVHYMCGLKGIDENALIHKTRHLYSIGSILFFENQDATVWGTGCIRNLKPNMNNILHQKIMRKLDVRAVRGPKTRDVLCSLGIKCPQVYGDPAVLMPYIYEPKINKLNRPVVIKHFKDNCRTVGVFGDALLLNPVGRDWKSKIDTIASAEYVISSSLHGIILAESYGVPAVLLKPEMEPELFKYEDYYLGTNRSHFPMVNTIEEGLEFKYKQNVTPNFDLIRKKLISAFPDDLWK